MSLNPAQTRAARVWLDWTQTDLATRAKIGLSTLRDFESGARTPIQNNVAAIQRALEDGGAAAFLEAIGGMEPPEAVNQSPAVQPGKRPGSGAGERRGKRSQR